MEQQNNKKHKFTHLVIIILALVLGFFAGITGEIFTRYYLSNFAFFRDLYFLDQNNSGQQDIIIRDPKKVVVDQELRIEQIKSDIQPSLVGVYVKSKSSKTLLDRALLADNFLGQAMVLTSDGWLVTSNGVISQDKENLEVVIFNKKIYEIEKVITDETTGIAFLKINAQNLPVVKLADFGEVAANQQVLVYNSYKQQIDLTSIQNKSFKQIESRLDLVSATENLDKRIQLNQSFSEAYYQGAAVINFQGEIVGIIAGDSQLLNQAVPINYIDSIISQVLKGEEIKRPSLGLNYLDISKTQGLSEEDLQGVEAGALLWPDKSELAIKKDSPLKDLLVAGDIITSVEGQPLDFNNDLADILLEYKVGQQISIKYLHNKVEQEISVVLQ